MQRIDSTKTALNLIEEIFNSITHGFGALAGIVGLILGVIFLTSSTSFKVGFIIYCASLIILMLTSALYHALTFTRAKKIFRVLDHGSIFLLIAGSFTPFIIFLYRGWAQALFLIGTWSLAVIGITVTTVFVLPKDMKITGVLLYICFGWMGLLFVPKLHLLNSSVVWLLVIGGILYTVGTVPFALKKPFTHFSWHLFVVAAACAQFFAIIKLT
jgi:hemolysin III